MLRSFKFKTCKTKLQSKSKISKLENQKKKKEWTHKKNRGEEFTG
jgi:hypothetical protein